MPSKWIKEPEIKPITKLLLTYGGGLGGQNIIEYVEQTDNIQPNTLQKFTRITGKEIILNTTYLISAENYELVTVTYNTQNKYRTPGIHKEHYLKSETPGDIILINTYGEN